MRPLDGIKILDFTQFLAGPLCTLLLSDLGADVIKLENPPLGDGTRYITNITNEKSSNYTTRNRGNKSVILNLNDERQNNIFLEMVKTADAVVENFKPGTLEIQYRRTESNHALCTPVLLMIKIRCRFCAPAKN